jgi:16S rRNA (guanine527-N7)-methyltransferase
MSAHADALRAAAGELGLPLTDQHISQLLAYLDLLVRWNKTYNLTAVRNPDDMLTQHLADCLAVVRPLRQSLENDAVKRPRILDVGSGAGLPGIVLSILNPDWHITCIDTVGKKTSFIQQAALELKLPQLKAVHARVESWKEEAANFDRIVSRAFASLADFTQLSAHLLGPQGCLMAMKGKTPTEAELQALPQMARMFHVEQLRVPGLDAERCLVWMRPRSGAN